MGCLLTSSDPSLVLSDLASHYPANRHALADSAVGMFQATEQAWGTPQSHYVDSSPLKAVVLNSLDLKVSLRLTKKSLLP